MNGYVPRAGKVTATTRTASAASLNDAALLRLPLVAHNLIPHGAPRIHGELLKLGIDIAQFVSEGGERFGGRLGVFGHCPAHSYIYRYSNRFRMGLIQPAPRSDVTDSGGVPRGILV
jgi:hypothetical protein